MTRLIQPKEYTIWLLIGALVFFFFVNSALVSQSGSNYANLQQQAASKEAKRIAQECKNAKNGFRQCAFQAFRELAQTHTFSFGLEAIHAIEKIDPQGRDCHLLAHAITAVQIKKDPAGWQELLKNINPNYCTGGFIHGIFEGLSQYDPTFTLNEKTLPKFCDIVKRTVKGGGGDQYCAHITGHLLLVETDANIPEAVKICDKVPRQIQYQCYGGIFMENITRNNLVNHGLSEDIPTTEETTANQEKICRQYKGLAATGCWREISHMYILLAHNDPKLTYGRCSRASSAYNRDECYRHAIGMIAREQRLKMKTMLSLCDPYITDEEEFNVCADEIVSTMLQASKNYAERARNFCGGIPDEYKPSCFSTIEQRLATASSPRDD